MPKLFETIHDVVENSAPIKNRPYGMIDVCNEKLVSIQLRPWPKLISGIEAKWADGWGKKRTQKNQAQVFYSQPIAHRNYLTLSYAVTTLNTSWTSLSLSLAMLDYVAYLKRSDAILTEVSNPRISDKVMRRLGYEPHLMNDSKRHWIRRFYGEYPTNKLLKYKMGISFDSRSNIKIASNSTPPMPRIFFPAQQMSGLSSLDHSRTAM